MREFKEMYKYEQYKRGAHEIAGDAASQPGGARMGLELQLVCPLCRSELSPQQEDPLSVQASRPGHENLEESELPAEW